MSLCEWFAAVEGYLESRGVDPDERPATWEDFEGLEHLRAPSRSIT